MGFDSPNILFLCFFFFEGGIGWSSRLLDWTLTLPLGVELVLEGEWVDSPKASMDLLSLRSTSLGRTFQLAMGSRSDCPDMDVELVIIHSRPDDSSRYPHVFLLSS